MVGLVGCGCCGPAQLCKTSPFKSSIVEDYSPAFDPYFAQPFGDVYNLKTVSGGCQAVGTENAFNYRQTSGAQYGFFKKASLNATVEVSLKLILWDDEIYQGTPQILLADLYAIIATDATAPFGITGFIGGNYRVIARAAFYNNTSYFFSVGNFQVKLGIRPKAGDIFGLRLSDFNVQQVNQFNVYVKPSKAECIINGNVVYTVTDQTNLFMFDACYLRSAIWLSEPYFVYPWGQVVPNRLRVDDFTHSSL